MKTCQLAIIGGGPAGYTAAEAAGKAGLDVVLFEKQSLGGVCLNEGCIPTKTLLYSAKVYDSARHAGKYAIAAEGVSFDLPKIIARKQKVVRKLVLGVKAKLAAAGVTVVAGAAEVLDRHHVRCGDDVYECANLLLCTGSETVVPPIPGVADVPYWTHREALECKELPASLVVVGGGVIGMEFASFFNSLGTKVTVVEMADEILGGMDGELAALLRAEYAKRGIAFHLRAKVARLEQTGGGIRVHLKGDISRCILCIEHIGGRDTVDPGPDPVPHSLYPGLVPVPVPEGRLRLRVHCQCIKPAQTRLIIDSSGPCPRCRIYLILVAVHPAVVSDMAAELHP